MVIFPTLIGSSNLIIILHNELYFVDNNNMICYCFLQYTQHGDQMRQVHLTMPTLPASIRIECDCGDGTTEIVVSADLSKCDEAVCKCGRRYATQKHGNGFAVYDLETR